MRTVVILLLALAWGQVKLEAVLALARLDLTPLVLRLACYAVAGVVTVVCYWTTETAVWRCETGTWRRDRDRETL